MMRIPRYQEPRPTESGVAATTTTTSTGPQTPSHNQKVNNMITAEIPREVSFDLPEGRYRARISNIKPKMKQAGSGPQEWIKFIFEVEVPGLSEKFNTMAVRAFRLDLNQGSELRNWLTGLLGRQFFKEHSGQPMSFDSLTGLECEIDLEHFQGNGYDQPLVVPARLFPATSKEPQIQRMREEQD